MKKYFINIFLTIILFTSCLYGQEVLSKFEDRNIAVSNEENRRIKDISTDGTLAGNSDTALPTEKAVKTYVDNNAGTTLWEVDGTETQLITADEIDMQSKSILNQRAAFLDEITVSDYDADLFSATWMEFPDAASSAGWIDMTGNNLLLHMNNDFDDSSGDSHDGTAQGATFTTSAKLGSHAGSFDGTNDYVDLGTTQFINSGTAFSLSVWFYNDNFTASYPVIIATKNDQAQNWRLILSNIASYKDISFGANASWARGTTGDIGLTTDEWHHIVITYNGNAEETLTNFKLYLDGKEKTISSGNIFGVDTGNSRIGTDGGNYWDGYIDELTIWSGVELGEDDVTKIYENQKIGKEGATAGEIILTDDGEFIGWNGTIWKIF